MASSPEPIRMAAGAVDLSSRFFTTSTVAASPALAAITAITTFTVNANVTIVSGIQLWAWAAFTIGTSGVSAKLDIRQTGTSGAVIATTGLSTVVAGNLVETGCQGFDAAAVIPGQVYAICLTIGSGAAASTVSALQLCGLII